MKKNYIIIVVSLFFIIIFSCGTKKHYLLSDLNIKNKNIILKENEILFLFNIDDIKEYSAFTKKKYSKYEFSFIPWRETGLNNSLSIYIHYQNSKNYCRLNLFLDNGIIHLYQNNENKVKTLIYKPIKPIYFVNEDDIIKMEINKNIITLKVNDKIFYSDKINFYEGKFGIGAYGKKGDKAKIIFN